MLDRLRSTLRAWLKPVRRPAPAIPAPLWLDTIGQYPFLSELDAQDLHTLQQLCAEFLAHKRFHGAGGLQVTDAMALAIAAQACLPVLELGLAWYDDFVGIVVHPGEMLARRELEDEAGVVHHYTETLAGEAMDGGPITLNWEDVRTAGQTAHTGYNLVVHEFVHKMDMRDGQANGCPPLPAGFAGHPSALGARKYWAHTIHTQWQAFAAATRAADRFAGLVERPWLDAYAATSVDEFFAVTAEAYFVAGKRFRAEFPELALLYDAFFRPGRQARLATPP